MARILFVNLEGRIAGAERSLLLLIEHLRAQFAISVACPAASPLAAALGSMRIDSFGLDGPANRSSFSILGLAQWLRTSWRLIRIVLKAKPDIIHANSFYSAVPSLLEALKGAGIMDNSIVFILGDHGEQFYEHGHTSHHGVYEELIHIPLAVSVPDTRAKGKRIDSLVSQVDILPTILDYLGIQIPEQCQGKSLKPLIEGQAEAVNEFVFAEYTGGAAPDTFMVRSGRYKFYQEDGSKPFAYDLAKDPDEQNRVFSDDFPAGVHSLGRTLKELMSK